MTSVCKPSLAGPMLLIHCDRSCSHALSSSVSSFVPNSPEIRDAYDSEPCQHYLQGEKKSRGDVMERMLM